MTDRVRRARLLGGATAACVVSLAFLPAPASAAVPATCFGRPVTIAGTDGADSVSGTRGSDVIATGGGKDSIIGDGFLGLWSSPDYVCAGDGDDFATGGRGDDSIDGGPGNDSLDDPIAVGTSAANDAHGGVDTVIGGAGDDYIDESLDGVSDTVDAGPGYDTCRVDRIDRITGCEKVIYDTVGI